ncbi:MAG: PGPGW domain-containing protein [Nitrospirae bacterium]|nr:PGPGW domain-containing protein [Nitrospirota bacterium]
MIDSIWRLIWRYIKIISGMAVLLAGIAMILLPGPAVIVIPMGLGILATELKWARDLLDKVKEEIVILSNIKGLKAKIIYIYDKYLNKYLKEGYEKWIKTRRL